MTDIANELEEEFAAIASHERKSRVAELEHIAAAAKEPLVVRSSGKAFVWLGLLSLPMILLGLFAPMEGAMRILVIVAGLGCFAAAYALYPMTKHPVMTLTEDAIVFSQANTRMPWTSVHKYSVVTVNGYVSLLRLHLTPKAETPPFQKSLYRYRYELDGKKDLVFNGIGPLLGLKPQEFLDRFDAFLAASRARAELARLRRA